MCLSTHEMNSPKLEREVANLERRISESPDSGTEWVQRVWGGRVEQLQKLLKERAEAGTYNDDFEAAARAERQRRWAEDD